MDKKMDKKEHEFIQNSKHPIENMYAWIIREPDGSESIVVLEGEEGFFPVIGSDLKRIESKIDKLGKKK